MSYRKYGDMNSISELSIVSPYFRRRATMKKANRFGLAVLFVIGGAARAIGQEQKPEKPWLLTPDQINAVVSAVRAGKDLTPQVWPEGAKVAVALSFDFDAETNVLRDGQHSPGGLSQGEYAARVAVPRILALMDKYRIAASFFVPAVTALLHPADIKAIMARGRHEVGLHGGIHERNSLLSEDDERTLMKKSFDTLKKVSGKAPVGIRTPSGVFARPTLNLIRELGLLYASSLMAAPRPSELLENGEQTGGVDLPGEWLRGESLH